MGNDRSEGAGEQPPAAPAPAPSLSPDLDRLLAFYTGLLGAEEVMRYPDDGPAFYVGLTLGNSELGRVRG